MQNLNVINVLEARLRSPEPLVFKKSPDGWIAKFGNATLICVNRKKIRHFKDLGLAAQALRRELGVEKFEIDLADA